MSLFESKQPSQRPSVRNDDGPFIKPSVQHIDNSKDDENAQTKTFLSQSDFIGKPAQTQKKPENQETQSADAAEESSFEKESDEKSEQAPSATSYWTHAWHTDRFGNEALFIWEVRGKSRYSNANKGYAYIRKMTTLLPEDADYDARFEKYKHRPQASEGSNPTLNWWFKKTPGWDNPDHADDGTADFDDLAEFKDAPENKKGTGFYYMGYVFDPLIYEKLAQQKRQSENSQYIGNHTNYKGFVSAPNGIILHETPTPFDEAYQSKSGKKEFIVSQNSPVTVIAEANEDNEGWLMIKTANGDEGWIERNFISRKPKPKTNQLFDTYTVKEGDNLEGLIKSYYQSYPTSTGNDYRTVALALYLYNKDKPGSGVYRDHSAYKSAGSWKDTIDPWMQETRANYASVKLYKGGEVILPPPIYIHKMRQIGLVEKRPDFVNAMIEPGRIGQGFIAGVGIGFWDALVGTGEDLYNMIVDIFTGQIFSQIADMFEFLWNKGLKGLWEMLSDVVTNTYEEIIAAWNNPNPFERGKYFGEIIGAILFEVVLAVLTWGVGSALKISSKAAKVLKWFPNLDSKKMIPKDIDKYADDIRKANRDKDLKRDKKDSDRDKDKDKDSEENKAEDAKALIAAKLYVQEADDRNPSPEVTLVLGAINRMSTTKLTGGKKYKAKSNGLGAGHYEIYYNPPVKKDYTEGKSGNSGKSNTERAKEIAQEVPDKWKKMYMCKQFASDLKERLVANGISGELIEMKTGTGFIYSDKFGNIATTGIHQAIQVDDIIFDNLRSTGIPYGEWINDLGGEVFTNPPHAQITKTAF